MCSRADSAINTEHGNKIYSHKYKYILTVLAVTGHHQILAQTLADGNGPDFGHTLEIKITLFHNNNKVPYGVFDH